MMCPRCGRGHLHKDGGGFLCGFCQGRFQRGLVPESPKCTICKGPADEKAELILAAKINSWVSRHWGGDKSHIPLCEECMWRLENLAGDAIAAEIERARNG